MKNGGKNFEDIISDQIPDNYKDWWLANYFQSSLKFMFNEIAAKQ